MSKYRIIEDGQGMYQVQKLNESVWVSCQYLKGSHTTSTQFSSLQGAYAYKAKLEMWDAMDKDELTVVRVVE